MVVEGQRTNFLAAKDVPDFESLYKKFVSTLERKKGEYMQIWEGTSKDVIGAFLDFTQGEINVTFTKNGEDQGDAFQISKEDLGEAALFPHIMTRNVKFEVNFGIDKAAADKENWKDALATDYVKVGKVEEAERVRGNPRMTSRESCEMIMMIGLPGCGKTTWVDKYVSENPEKQYNVVSTTTMINKMTVKTNSHIHLDSLIPIFLPW